MSCREFAAENAAEKAAENSTSALRKTLAILSQRARTRMVITNASVLTDTKVTDSTIVMTLTSAPTIHAALTPTVKILQARMNALALLVTLPYLENVWTSTNAQETAIFAQRTAFAETLMEATFASALLAIS